MNFLDKIFGGKVWYKSITGWGMLVLILAETAVPFIGANELLSPEFTSAATLWMEKIAALLVAAGIRKAVSGNS